MKPKLALGATVFAPSHRDVFAILPNILWRDRNDDTAPRQLISFAVRHTVVGQDCSDISAVRAKKERL